MLQRTKISNFLSISQKTPHFVKVASRMLLSLLSIRRGSSMRPAAMRALSMTCCATSAATASFSGTPCACARAIIILWLGLISSDWGGKSACLFPGLDWFCS